MHRFLVSILPIALLLSGPTTVLADELTTPSYVALTHDLMRVTALEWQEKGSPPDSMVLAIIYAGYGCTEREYLAYMGAHADEVDSYLEQRPALRAEINALNRSIRDIIAGLESSEPPAAEGN